MPVHTIFEKKTAPSCHLQLATAQNKDYRNVVLEGNLVIPHPPPCRCEWIVLNRGNEIVCSEG
jgi:hypothetical protein